MKWLLTFVCCLPMLAWAAPVYQCHDKWGNPVFSDQPCGDKAKKIEMKSANVIDGHALTSGITDADLKAAEARWQRQQTRAAIKEKIEAHQSNIEAIRQAKGQQLDHLNKQYGNGGEVHALRVQNQQHFVAEQAGKAVSKEQKAIERLKDKLSPDDPVGPPVEEERAR